MFFTSLTFFSLSAKADNELEQECLKYVHKPTVSISTSYGDLQYDHSKSRRQLTRLHLNMYKSRKLGGNLLNGLSTFEHAININAKIRKETIPTGITCVYPKEVNLHFGAGENPIIYIARDYEKGTCMYNVVLRHEQTHQQINQSVLEYYLPEVQDKFIDVVKNNVIASRSYNINITTAQEELQKKYLEVLNPILEDVKTKTEAEQAKLDSDENYDYEASICQNKD